MYCRTHLYSISFYCICTLLIILSSSPSTTYRDLLTAPPGLISPEKPARHSIYQAGWTTSTRSHILGSTASIASFVLHPKTSHSCHFSSAEAALSLAEVEVMNIHCYRWSHRHRIRSLQCHFPPKFLTTRILCHFPFCLLFLRLLWMALVAKVCLSVFLSFSFSFTRMMDILMTYAHFTWY